MLFSKNYQYLEKESEHKKTSQYFGCSTVTNSSILVSYEQCAPAVVCLTCAAHTDEGKERPPATELPLSLLLEGSQDGKYLLVLDEREAQHPFTTLLGFFTGIVLKAVKLSAQPESVICLYGDNVVSIPLLHGK